MNRPGIDFPESKRAHGSDMSFLSAIRTFHKFDLYLCQGLFTPADGGITNIQSSDLFRISSVMYSMNSCHPGFDGFLNPCHPV
jgi:hypothetical protein